MQMLLQTNRLPSLFDTAAVCVCVFDVEIGHSAVEPLALLTACPGAEDPRGGHVGLCSGSRRGRRAGAQRPRRPVAFPPGVPVVQDSSERPPRTEPS